MPSALPRSRAPRPLRLVLALLSVGALLAAFPAGALATHNNAWQNFELLDTDDLVVHSNVGATVQSDPDYPGGEPLTAVGPGYCNNGAYDPNGGVFMGATLWYRVPGNGAQLRLSTAGSDFDTVLAVYGTDEFYCDDDGGSDVDSLIQFTSRPGVTYWVQLGGIVLGGTADTGEVVLDVTSGPANDARASAQVVQTGTTTPSHNILATVESGEATSCGTAPFGKTTWFRWTAPSTGDAVFVASDAVTDTVLSVYSAGGGLLGCSDDAVGSGTSSRLPLRVRGGQAYDIQVGGYGTGDAAAEGPFNLGIEFTHDSDVDGDGSSPPADCDDENPNRHPAAADVTNGIDDNCDGIVDPDRDGDTYLRAPLGKDCNDDNPAIHPGARDIRGNRINEDCAGAPAPFRRIRASLDPAGRHEGALTVLTRLVVQNVPKGSKVSMRCFAPGAGRRRPSCGTSARRASAAGVPVRAARNVTVRGFARLLRPGTVIEVRATKRGYIGFVQSVTMKASGAPARGRALCTYPGSSKPRKRCAGIR